MSKKSKILLGLSVVIGLLTLIVTSISNNKKRAIIPTGPEKVVIPTRQPEPTIFNDTGALYISPTDEQYELDQLVGILRNKCPFETNIFIASYNYSTDKFIFMLKDKTNGSKQLDDWMVATGYDKIPKNIIEVN